MNNQKPKVLITYALAGLGHLREGVSMQKAFTEAGIESDLLDIVEWGKNHNLISKIAIQPIEITRRLHKFLTKHSDVLNSSTEMSPWKVRLINLSLRGSEVPIGFQFRKFLINSEYTHIVSIHPWNVGAIWSFGIGKNFPKPVINVSPDELDFTSTSLYTTRGKNAPLLAVASKETKDNFLKAGMDKDRIVIIGHTLDADLYKERANVYKRVSTKLKSKEPLNLGFFIGGSGTSAEKTRIIDAITKLSSEIKAGKYNIYLVPGPHVDFYEEIKSKLRDLGLSESKNIEILIDKNTINVVTEGNKWLKDKVDVLFSKPGELIFYALGGGFPMIHFPPKGTQEISMMELLMSFKAIHNYDEIKDLTKFLEDRDYLLEMSSNAFNSGYKLDGSYEVVKLVKGEL